MEKVFLLVLLLLTCGTCYANDGFKCTIKDAVHLENDGKLNHKSEIVGWYIGKEFVVDRKTGLIVGAKLSNSMTGQMPKVYDYNQAENSYRAVTIYQKTGTIDYLEIHQYSKELQKSFLFKEAFGTILSGICIDY